MIARRDHGPVSGQANVLPSGFGCVRNASRSLRAAGGRLIPADADRLLSQRSAGMALGPAGGGRSAL